VYPSPVKVAYATVRELIPQMWGKETKRIDYMVHVGMAGGREYYSVERRGHRDGYMMADVDGVVLGEEKWKGDRWIWNGCPEEIMTSVDVDDVWQRWRSALPVRMPMHIYLCNSHPDEFY
jgi:pyroglutamyl-peptidase